MKWMGPKLLLVISMRTIIHLSQQNILSLKLFWDLDQIWFISSILFLFFAFHVFLHFSFLKHNFHLSFSRKAEQKCKNPYIEYNEPLLIRRYNYLEEVNLKRHTYELTGRSIKNILAHMIYLTGEIFPNT